MKIFIERCNMVYNLVIRNGCGMITESKECLPVKEAMKRMLDDGAKFYVDGKKVGKAEAIAMCLKRKELD